MLLRINTIFIKKFIIILLLVVTGCNVFDDDKKNHQPLTILSTSIDYEQKISVYSKIIITSNYTIDIESAKSFIFITDELKNTIPINFELSENNLIIKPYFHLAQNKKYNLIINKGLISANGMKLDYDLTYNFSTIKAITYIADKTNNKILTFDNHSQGNISPYFTLQGEQTKLNGPIDMSIYDNYLFVANSGDHKIIIFRIIDEYKTETIPSYIIDGIVFGFSNIVSIFSSDKYKELYVCYNFGSIKVFDISNIENISLKRELYIYQANMYSMDLDESNDLIYLVYSSFHYGMTSYKFIRFSSSWSGTNLQFWSPLYQKDFLPMEFPGYPNKISVDDENEIVAFINQGTVTSYNLKDSIYTPTPLVDEEITSSTPITIHLDGINKHAYLVVKSGESCSVRVYNSTFSNNQPPLWTLSGNSTQITDPVDIVVRN